MYVPVRVPLHPDHGEPDYDCEREIECWHEHEAAPEIPELCPCGHRFSEKQRRQLEHRVLAAVRDRWAA